MEYLVENSSNDLLPLEYAELELETKYIDVNKLMDVNNHTTIMDLET